MAKGDEVRVDETKGEEKARAFKPTVGQEDGRKYEYSPGFGELTEEEKNEILTKPEGEWRKSPVLRLRSGRLIRPLEPKERENKDPEGKKWK